MMPPAVALNEAAAQGGVSDGLKWGRGIFLVVARVYAVRRRVASRRGDVPPASTHGAPGARRPRGDRVLTWPGGVVSSWPLPP